MTAETATGLSIETIAVNRAPCAVALESQTLEITLRAPNGTAESGAIARFTSVSGAEIAAGERQSLGNTTLARPTMAGAYQIEASLSRLGWKGADTIVIR